ncbi:MAG: hypothetical protein EXS64_12310 [Candidatus Latescibacteria bacterium]|nr:hypothetical protein [Candidatus Latescibacterota bacterium]
MSFRHLYILGGAALCCALALWIGCGSGPFQITGPPAAELPRGFALITADVPLYIRGVIRRVQVEVTAADTSRREMNFPIPAGSLAAGEVANLPVGRRQFTVMAFDTQDALRFRGSVVDSVKTGQATTMSVPLARIGGTLRFTATVPRTNAIDSLAATSLLDIVELDASRDLPRLALASTPVISFTREGNTLSRQVTIKQIPTGDRRFVGNLRDLRRGGRFVAFMDTVMAKVDTGSVGDVKFTLKALGRSLQDQEFVLPADSTVVVTSPNF